MLFLLVILLYAFVWLGLCLAYHVEVHNIHCAHAMKRKKNYKIKIKPIVFFLIHLFKYDHMPLSLCIFVHALCEHGHVNP